MCDISVLAFISKFSIFVRFSEHFLESQAAIWKPEEASWIIFTLSKWFCSSQKGSQKLWKPAALIQKYHFDFKTYKKLFTSWHYPFKVSHSREHGPSDSFQHQLSSQVLIAPSKLKSFMRMEKKKGGTCVQGPGGEGKVRPDTQRQATQHACLPCWAMRTNNVKKCAVRKIIFCTGLARAAKAG